MTFIDIITSTGEIGIIIGGIWIVFSGMALERVLYFYQLKNSKKDSCVQRVLQAIQQRKLDDARGMLKQDHQDPAFTLLKDLMPHTRQLIHREEDNLIHQSLEPHIKAAFRHQLFMKIGATAATSLGMIGTVWGMISAFSSLAISSNLKHLGGGISMAMATTLAGLVLSLLMISLSKVFRQMGQSHIEYLMQTAYAYVNSLRSTSAPVHQN